VFGKFAEVVIARADFDPRVRHADQRLFEIIVLQSGSAQHGAGASAVGAADEGLTAKLCKWIGHVAFLSKTRPDEGGYSAANISAKKNEKAITQLGMMARISRKLCYAITRFCR
jgi:hypothetical protein